MSIKLYNTLSRKKEDFVPIKEGKAGIYACGPTVYWFAHVGNFRYFIFTDILNRTLMHSGLDVSLIMNITDVGHLTGDADEGEDKMIVAMRKEGKSAWEIADFYSDAFFRDSISLNILPADKYPRATDHIQEQIDMIKKIEKNGFTYQIDDGIYFDTTKLADYGMLSGQSLDEKMAGARVAVGDKKSPTDFALWKFTPEGVDREMEWSSPWGKGFPGWHIECSAMSTKYLGIPFDIHTGGIDHLTVHHENEIAQSSGAENKPQAHFWMHIDFLQVDGGKMSKSLGNLFTVPELVEKGYDPISYRYFCLGAHYRTKLNFTFEALDASQNALTRLRNLVRDWKTPAEGAGDYEKDFEAAINDDLDIPKALSIVWKMVDDNNVCTSAKSATLLKFDEVLGLGLKEYIAKTIKVPTEVEKLVQEREQVRQAKDFEASDRLREEIETHGFTVKDTPDGPKIIEKQ